jgi:hypothetical protein
MNNVFPISLSAFCCAMLVASSSLVLYSCREEKAVQQKIVDDRPASPIAGCHSCHPVLLDDAHNRPCTSCHDGNAEAVTREDAHASMTARPAHPAHMVEKCSPCHQQAVEAAANSLHFTLKNELNLVRGAFGAKEKINSVAEIQTPEKISSILDLTDDLLRRRCLICHPYSSGDTYSGTVRGTGCASCHLNYANGALLSHAFVRIPNDEQCLHCHYGNHVGADYYGRFEHDFSQEFRTPYRTDISQTRPYGVEYHQLAPDIHQQAGMACVDCHPASQLMGTGHTHSDGDNTATGRTFPSVSCADCHFIKVGRPLPLPTMHVREGRLEIATASGHHLVAPPAVHPAHQTYSAIADCMVCHAQWTFTDKGTHLMRHDSEDYDPWAMLTVQGSHLVEDQLINGRWGDWTRYESPGMPDSVTGILRPGIWFKGFEVRRWEYPLIGTDEEGRLRIIRPILDLHLSYMDQEGTVHYDSVPSKRSTALRPYTPHTVGKAGAFYRLRLKDNHSAYSNTDKLFLEK